MICPNCNKTVGNGVTCCPFCATQLGDPPNQPRALKHIKSYLLWSLLLTVFCLPAGIFALAFSVKVKKLVADGDIRSACDCSVRAKEWIIRLFVFTAIVYSVIVLGFAQGCLPDILG